MPTEEDITEIVVAINWAILLLARAMPPAQQKEFASTLDSAADHFKNKEKPGRKNRWDVGIIEHLRNCMNGKPDFPPPRWTPVVIQGDAGDV